ESRQRAFNAGAHFRLCDGLCGKSFAGRLPGSPGRKIGATSATRAIRVEALFEFAKPREILAAGGHRRRWIGRCIYTGPRGRRVRRAIYRENGIAEITGSDARKQYRATLQACR